VESFFGGEDNIHDKLRLERRSAYSVFRNCFACALRNTHHAIRQVSSAESDDFFGNTGLTPGFASPSPERELLRSGEGAEGEVIPADLC